MALDIGFGIDTWDVFDSLIGRRIGKVWVGYGGRGCEDGKFLDQPCDGQISFQVTMSKGRFGWF